MNGKSASEPYRLSAGSGAERRWGSRLRAQQGVAPSQARPQQIQFHGVTGSGHRPGIAGTSFRALFLRLSNRAYSASPPHRHHGTRPPYGTRARPPHPQYVFPAFALRRARIPSREREDIRCPYPQSGTGLVQKGHPVLGRVEIPPGPALRDRLPHAEP